METPAIAPSEHVDIQERVVGDVRWIAIRARGAEWSWLTPQEAVELAREWKRKRRGRDLLTVAVRRGAGLLRLEAQALHSVLLVGDDFSGNR